MVGIPEAAEYGSSFGNYIQLVQSQDVMAALAEMPLTGLRSVTAEDSLRRYAPGKWSLREVVGHLIDSERVFAYRAMRFARADSTALPGFEQDDWIPAAHFDRRPWSELLDEFELVRKGNLLLFGGFDSEAWLRRGVANGVTISVRAIVYAIAGHELHHLRIVREKYLAV